jgi:hypothetical protein
MRLPTARRLLAAAAVTSLAALGAVALPPAGAGAAGTFTIYHAPPGLSGSGDAGEPSIGSNWATGNAMYQAGLSTYRVAFDDAAGTASWTDKSSTLTSITSLDPILFTDHSTNRTFVSQLDGACSLMAYSDDDGDSWAQNPVGCGIGAAVDHQTVGGGPYAPGATGVGLGYPDITYFCAQAILSAQCAA